jgi:hypothetical protein
MVKMNSKLNVRHYSVLCFALLVLALPLFASAQDGTPIEIIGVVSEVNTSTITVAGVPVDVSGVTLSADVTIGATISVTGVRASANVIVAQTIVIISIGTPPAESTAEVTPSVTPLPTLTPTAGAATPTATPAPDVIVIEGPVINIINNIITIYDFDVEVEPENPILTIIDIGDIIRVEGALRGSNVIVATVVSNITAVNIVDNGGPATVGLEGPVESINGNIIVVNGVSVELGPNDPLLQTVQIGTFVNVWGNFHRRGNTYVLVVVNVVIINDIDIVDNDCWFHYDGMGMGMGHWHCDGMGMGMGDPGMGMGMGMGR